jgi:hypothetical protein
MRGLAGLGAGSEARRSQARSALGHLVDMKRNASVTTIPDSETLGADGFQREFPSFRFRKEVRHDQVTLAKVKSFTAPGTPDYLWFWFSGSVNDRSFRHVTLPNPVYVERNDLNDGANLPVNDGSAEDSGHVWPS